MIWSLDSSSWAGEEAGERYVFNLVLGTSREFYPPRIYDQLTVVMKYSVLLLVVTRRE
jgi:hypothetical protein